MAQAADQHTASEWSLTKVHRYLTGVLGYEKIRALYMMEQCRLVERLPIKVQKFVDGKPEGDPFDLPTDKTHDLVHYGGSVYPRGLPWGDYRCTVTEQNARALLPAPAMGQSPQEKSLKSKDWLAHKVEWRKKLGDIPKDITTFSGQLHGQMVTDARTGVVDYAMAPRTIERWLREWKVFPKKRR